MGNHSAGRDMNATAITAWYLIEKNQTVVEKQEAIDLLDYICNGYRGCDAEFEILEDDYVFATDPNAPIGKLIAIAFGDGRDWAGECAKADDRTDENVWGDWYNGPVKQFDLRYEFC